MTNDEFEKSFQEFIKKDEAQGWKFTWSQKNTAKVFYKMGQQSVLDRWPSDREIGEYYDKNTSELYALMNWLKSKLGEK